MAWCHFKKMKKKNFWKVLICVLGLMAVMICALLAVKFVGHERNQSQQIQYLTTLVQSQAEELRQLRELPQSLMDQLSMYEERIMDLEAEINGNDFLQACSADGFDYLAIGNSITIHNRCDYWWSESGMAASTPELDYFHRVVSRLQNVHAQINSTAVNFAIWETLDTDRAEMLVHIENYLCGDLDLVTIQLGENVNDLSTFKNDFLYLVTYIQEKAPQARIIVVGDFWRYEDRDQLKAEVSAACNVSFVDLTEIADKEAYMCASGSVVYDEEGNAHIVEHTGVSRHPNDAAMEYIADGILKLLDKE